MRTDLETIAPAFVATAHRTGYAVVATVGLDDTPRTRVMQPVWRWDGATLTGWVSTTTDAPKVAEARRRPSASLTYWHPDQDSCTADVRVTPVTGAEELAAAWDRFLATPPPAGFDPAIHPDWESAASPTFGVLRLDPVRLRVLPGSLVRTGEGTLLTWQAPVPATAG